MIDSIGQQPFKTRIQVNNSAAQNIKQNSCYIRPSNSKVSFGCVCGGILEVLAFLGLAGLGKAIIKRYSAIKVWVLNRIKRKVVNSCSPDTSSNLVVLDKV